MRVLLCINSLRSGGAERVMSILGNEFVDKDVDVTIVTISKSGSNYILDKRINLIELECGKQSTNFIQGIFNFLVRIRKLLVTFRNVKPDGCISFMTETNIISIIVGLISNVPVIVSERTNPELHVTGKFYKILRWIFYRYATKIVVQTKKVMEFYENFLNSSKIETIANPIVLSDFRSKLEFHQRENVIINIGRLSQEKNQVVLIESFALSLAPAAGWKLQIFGEGPLHKILENKINSLNMSGHIKLMGGSNMIGNILKESAIYILSSKYEGFPNALLEALASGMACVSTNCKYGPSELIENEVNGLLINSSTPSALSEAINKLVVNDKLRQQISEKAPSSVANFDHSIILKKWLDISEESFIKKNQLK